MRFAKLVALSAVLLCAVTTSGYAATGAERHVAKGVKCEICHGPDKANPQLPTIDNCMRRDLSSRRLDCLLCVGRL